MSRMEAALRPRELAALPPVARQIRPAGAMAEHLGRQYTVEELDDEDKVLEEDRRFLPLVRAYEVTPLLGATFTIRTAEDITSSLGRLLAEKLPGIGWHLEGPWLPALAKYQLVHTSLVAPPDLATGQPMALEIYGDLWSVDGLRLDTPAGQEWSYRQREANVQAFLNGLQGPQHPPGSEFIIRLKAATYANVLYAGAGVAFYM